MSFSPSPTEEAVRQCLAYVVDPELGINIVDLGLVYLIQACDESIAVDMTMTTPACPMGTMIRDEAECAVRETFPAVKKVEVNLVWAPAWKPEMMSEVAKSQLGWK